jgi:hypothetical protein
MAGSGFKVAAAGFHVPGSGFASAFVISVRPAACRRQHLEP